MARESSPAPVTGATPGSGRAVALHYGRHGARVMAAAIDEAPVQQVVAELAAVGAWFYKADVACNNAGIAGELSRTADYSPAG